MRGSIVLAALVAALVGFGGTLALVVAAAQAVDATPAETASWVAGTCLAKAAATTFLSWRHRIPIIGAWSTPGLALLAASGGAVDLPAAVGAFIVAAVLLIATALLRPLGALVARIPPTIAAAMLAGILLRFALGVFEAAAIAPSLVLPLVLLFLVVRLASPFAAVLAVLAAGVGMAALTGAMGALAIERVVTAPVLVMPRFEPGVAIGLGLPLYLVTMASQNLPGFAVLRAAGYPVPIAAILAVTGLASLASAFVGAHTTNLAAITASICTGPDAHPDPAQRWLTGPVYALCYLVFAAFAGLFVAVIAAMPAVLIATVAGTALLAPLAGALGQSMTAERQRFAAILTLAVTASGLTLLGLGAAFWGLLAGLAVLAADRVARRGT
jgi:benzoate membrane transport protein